MNIKFSSSHNTIPIFAFEATAFDAYKDTLDEFSRNFVEANGFQAKLGQITSIPGSDGKAGMVALSTNKDIDLDKLYQKL